MCRLKVVFCITMLIPAGCINGLNQPVGNKSGHFSLLFKLPGLLYSTDNKVTK